MRNVGPFMRLAFVLALAGLAAAAMLVGVPAMARSADVGTAIVGAGLALGILSALGPRPRRHQPVAHVGRRALLR
jgi:hypothetical protein